ncbi:hypothetical protein ACLSZ7_11360 [Avibacterium gallinarum]|uniref:hypothetical protein n=1 Tax=Avibacterium gallinarum TaxID=755 RepID=UPI003BF83B86
MFYRQIAFFFVVKNEFRSLSDLLSFAYPKERKQRKEKGTPIKPLFPHSNKIFLTKNQPDVRYALAGVIFLKILSSFGRFGRGNSVRANFKVRWEF